MNTLILVFIGVIVGAILLTASAQQVGTATQTEQAMNISLSTIENETAQFITNYRALTNVEVYNETGGIVAAGNYTITNNVVNNGALAVRITPGLVDDYIVSAWMVSGTGQPLTYIDSSGGRSMASLIVIFFALAIASFALYPVLESRLLR